MLFLSSCGVSDLSAGFQSGQRMQDSLDNGTLELMDRSPAVASGDNGLIASTGNRSVIDRSPRISLAFSGLFNLRDEVRNDDLTVYDSYSQKNIPTFFEWAGKFVRWSDNSDYKVLFTYYHAQKTIEYVDRLFDEALIPGAYIHYWRRQSSDVPTPPNGVDRDEILPALPLTVYADETKDPDGNTMTADASHFCPSFNVDHRSNGLDYCIDNSETDFDSIKAEEGAIKRVMTFYRHQQSPIPYFNPADDADTIYHEMGHVVQLIVNGRSMENPVGTNGHMDALLEGVADFFAGAVLQDSSLFRYSMANFKAAFPTSFAGSSVNNQRDLSNTLRFPDNFVGLSDDPDAPSVGNSHMSGRIISGLLYDLKKLYDGSMPPSVRVHCDLDELSALTLCGQTTFTAITVAGQSDWSSWDIVLSLMLRTMISDSTDVDPLNADHSTFHHFAKKLVEECQAAVDLECPADDLLDLVKIRGLYSLKEMYPDQIAGATTAPYITEPERIYSIGPSDAGDLSPDDWGVTADDQLGFLEYNPSYSGAPADGYWSNSDGVIDPCEVLVIFPQLINRTHVMEARSKGLTDEQANPATMGADIFDFKIAMNTNGFDGFLPFLVNGTLIENVASPGYVDDKVIPWLSPGQSTSAAELTDSEGDSANSYLRDAFAVFGDSESHVFDVHQDYRVSKNPQLMKAKSTKNDFPSNIGWIVRAPLTAGDVGAASFTVRYKVYNQFYKSDSGAAVPGISPLSVTFSQSLTVSGTESFCDR